MTYRSLVRSARHRTGLVPPLRFAIANNYHATYVANADATFKNVRSRMPFRIASTNLSQLTLSLNGWYQSGGAADYTNPFTIIKISIEKNGQTFSVPVTFGGLRTKTINPGDVDIQSDPIMPAAFGLSSFTRGDLYYIRQELQVTNSTDQLPQGSVSYNPSYGYPEAVGLKIPVGGPAVSPVDSYGNMLFSGTSGTDWANYNNPYIPIILGRAVSGDIKSIIGVGDSIVSGQGDSQPKGLSGSFTRALFDTDNISNPIAGANFGMAGTIAATWSNATSSRLKAYLKYAKYMYEEFGTNEYQSAPGTAPATVLASSQAIWTAATAAGVVTILRPKLIPRTNSDGVTFLNAAWQTGGNARAFNALLDSTSGITVVPRNGLRAGATEGTDAFYQWVGGTTNTGDGTHPNAPGYTLDAADIRVAIAALP